MNVIKKIKISLLLIMLCLATPVIFAGDTLSADAVKEQQAQIDVDEKAQQEAKKKADQEAQIKAEKKEQEAKLSLQLDALSAQISELETASKEEKKQLATIKKKLQGEERALVARSLLENGRASRKILDDIIDDLKTLSADGHDVSAPMKRVKALTKLYSSILISEIRFVNKLVRELRPQRDTLEIDPLYLLEKQLSRARKITDSFFTELLANTARKEAVGFNIQEDLEGFDERISRRADDTAGRLKLASEQVDLVNAQAQKIGADQQRFELELNVAEEKQLSFLLSLTSLVVLMKERDIETTGYSQLLVTKGEIQGNLDSKVVANLLEVWFEDSKEWVITNSSKFFIKALSILTILLVFKLISIVAKRIVQRAIKSSSKIKISKLLQEFFINMIGRLIMLIGLLIALSQMGIEIGALLAGLGVVGFIVGFALQDTLSNFASGLMILLYRPFDVGDIIEVTGVKGFVREMSLVSTTVLGFNNEKLVVPNNKIWGDTIRNITSESVRRVDFSFPVGHDADVEQVEQILQNIVAQNTLILRSPETVIKLHEIDEFGVRFIVRAWASKEDYWAVYWDIMRQVKVRFKAENIALPYPRFDLSSGDN